MIGKKLAVVVALLGAGLMSAPAEAGRFQDMIMNLGAGGSYYPDQVPRGRAAPPKYKRQTVAYKSGEKPGTIVIETRQHYLYYVLGKGQAIRYGVGVGRDGFGWRGTVHVGNKQEWPTWTPPPEMIERERKRGRILPARMRGGLLNPLGARALYLYDGERRYHVPHPRHHGAVDDRPQRLLRLHPAAQPRRRRPL